MTLELVPFRGHTVPVLNGEISRYNVAELIAQIQYAQGYLGAPMPVTTYGNRPAEPITNSFQGFVEGMLYPDGPVAAAEAYRLRVFGQAPILYQELVDGRPGDLFDDEALDRLRAPWPGASLGDLMKRILIYGDFGGNGFILDIEDDLVLVRPDWVEFVLAKRMHRGGQVGWKQVGIVYYEGGLNVGDGVPFLPGEYSHFLPGLPDPLANYRGMSWLTPLVREVQADKRAHEHKLAYFENAAAPNLAVSLPKEITPSQFEAFVAAMDDKHKGSQNAYKTLYTAGGADVTVIGANMQQMDFSSVIGKGETRIANAAGVPPTLLSFSEGMQGSSLNAGNYTAAKRNFVDTTMRDLWANFAGSLQQMEAFQPPREKSRLWYDGRDIPFLHEDAKDLAEIQQTRASTINSYITAGFEPESATLAVLADDVKLLKHTGLTSVQLMPPGSQDTDGDGIPDAEAEAGEDYEAALDEFRSELAWHDEIVRKFNPDQPRAAWVGGVGGKWAATGALRDALNLAGRIDLDPGEEFVGSDKIKTDYASVRLAATQRNGRRLVRLGLGDGMFGSRDDEGGPWRGRDTAAEENARRAPLLAEYLALQSGAGDMTPAEQARFDVLEEMDLNEINPSGHTARLDEASAARLRTALAEDLDKALQIKAAEDARFDEMERLEAQRKPLRNMDRKWTDAEEARWDDLTAQIEALQAADPYPNLEDFPSFEGSVPGEWADIHYEIEYYDNEVNATLSAVPHGTALEDMRGNDEAASVDSADLQRLIGLLDRALSGEAARSYIERRDYYDIRVDAGRQGGGRFRKLSDIVGALLNDWLSRKGDADDPLEEFESTQLRTAAKGLGIPLPRARRGASPDETRNQLKLAILKDARARFRADRDAEGDEPRQARLTLQSKAFRDLDIGVYQERDGKVSLYRESGSGQRGSKVVTVESLAELEQWGREQGEPQVETWARSERDAPPLSAVDKSGRATAVPSKEERDRALLGDVEYERRKAAGAPAKKAAPRKAPAKKAPVKKAAPAVSPELAREVKVENRIRAAYRALKGRTDLPESTALSKAGVPMQRVMREGGYVSLADLRDEIGSDIPRTEVDAALHRVFLEPGWTIEDSVAGWSLLPREQEAAVRIGGMDNHWLKIDDPSDRPLPVAPPAKAAPRKAAKSVPAKATRPKREPLGDPEVARLKAEADAEDAEEREDGGWVPPRTPRMNTPYAAGFELDRAHNQVQADEALEGLTAAELKGVASAKGLTVTGSDVEGLRRQIVEQMAPNRPDWPPEWPTDPGAVGRALKDLAKLHGVPAPDGPYGPLFLQHVGLRDMQTIADRFDVDWRGLSKPELDDAILGAARARRAKGTPRSARQPLADPAAKLASLRALGDVEAVRDDLDLHTVAELKILAGEVGVATSGRKRDVVDRITAKIDAGRIEAPTTDLDPESDTRKAQVENAIRQAYRELAPPAGRNGGRVKLADIRDALGERFSRAEVDAVLARMARDSGGRDLQALENQQKLTQADRDSELRVGARKYHFLRLTDSADRPAATDPERAARDRQARLDTVRTAAEALVDLDTMAANGGSEKALRQRVDTRVRMGALTEAEGDRLHEALAGERLSVQAVFQQPTGDPGTPVAVAERLGDRYRIVSSPDGYLVQVEGADGWEPIGGPYVKPRELPGYDWRTVGGSGGDRFRTAVADILSSRGATTHHTVGDTVPFDPASMRAQGDRPDRGTPVQVVSPGATLTEPDGTVVTLAPTVVMDVPTPDVPKVRPSGLPTDRKAESGDFDDLANRITALRPKTLEAVMEILQDLSAPELGRLARKFQGDVMFVPGANKVSSRRRGLAIPAELSLEEKRRWLAEKLSARTFTWRSVSPDDDEIERSDVDGAPDGAEEGEVSRAGEPEAAEWDDVVRAAGHDTTLGNDELHHWWVFGEGRARWRTWTELRDQLLEHVSPEKAATFASAWFHERYGYYAGSDLNRVKHGKPPRGDKVGPG